MKKKDSAHVERKSLSTWYVFIFIFVANLNLSHWRDKEILNKNPLNNITYRSTSVNTQKYDVKKRKFYLEVLFSFVTRMRMYSMDDFSGLLCADDFIAVMTESLTHDTSNWGGMKTPIGGGLIGLGNLPDQITSKLLKRGFDLNVMLVGRSGLGKSTLVDTLFKAKVGSWCRLEVDSPRKNP